MCNFPHILNILQTNISKKCKLPIDLSLASRKHAMQFRKLTVKVFHRHTDHWLRPLASHLIMYNCIFTDLWSPAAATWRIVRKISRRRRRRSLRAQAETSMPAF